MTAAQLRAAGRHGNLGLTDCQNLSESVRQCWDVLRLFHEFDGAEWYVSSHVSPGRVHHTRWCPRHHRQGSEDKGSKKQRNHWNHIWTQPWVKTCNSPSWVKTSTPWLSLEFTTSISSNLLSEYLSEYTSNAWNRTFSYISFTFYIALDQILSQHMYIAS